MKTARKRVKPPQQINALAAGRLAARSLDFSLFLNPSVELNIVKIVLPGQTKFNWSCGTCLPFSSAKQRRRHVAALPKSGPQMSPETQPECHVLTNKSFV